MNWLTQVFAFDWPSPGTLAMLIPIFVFMIPIVGILTAHQRKMAELMQRKTSDAELEALRREVQELRQLVNQQAIALDNLSAGPAIPGQRISVEA